MPSHKLQDLAPSNDPQCVLASGTAGLPIAVLPIPASGTTTNDYHPTPRIYVAHAGAGRRQYRRGFRTLDLQTSPRMIEVYEAGLLFERSEWSGQVGRCVEVQFSDADVEAMTDGEVHALRWATRHEVFDERVSSLVLQLAEEVVSGMPSGLLFNRGLTLALLGLLSSTYAGHPLSTAARKLTPEQKRRVADLVMKEFGSKLTIDRMAAEARLSPYHFARLFKPTFDMTPHEYVLSIRIDAAIRALGQSDRPISEVALMCGFAGQSHMTALMRSKLGTTPRVLRRDSGR